MSDEYQFAGSKGLKFKNSDGIGKKKKKKRDADRMAATVEAAAKESSKRQPAEEGELDPNSADASSSGASGSGGSGIRLTKAELAFRATQERLATKRIMEKASKSHKQRVESFNRHLDSLTEHYDIPKVSWTK